MRTSTLTIRGTEYPCCFSTRVLLALEERGKREKPVKSATGVVSSIRGNEGLWGGFGGGRGYPLWGRWRTIGK